MFLICNNSFYILCRLVYVNINDVFALECSFFVVFISFAFIVIILYVVS